MRLGVVRERAHHERRVAIAPASLKGLLALGFDVIVEVGAGAESGMADTAYEAAGARIVSGEEAWSADVVAMIHPPDVTEVERLRPGSLLVCMLQPATHEDVVAALAQRGVNALALDKVPRISRAQKMDVLSSMANIAGYRAVLEGAAEMGRFLGAQTTAAGSEPPAKVLIIGAGVAGLAAVAAAKSLGAEVRAFDTRSATREQVESLGATFLEVDIDEDGEGVGGYAKQVSAAFIAAEMELFRRQCREVDLVVTTARVAGTQAPILLPEDVVSHLKPGSVVVDLAASQGGNCPLTRAGTVVEHGGVRYMGYTDWESRMAPVASRFFSANVTHLLRNAVAEGAVRLDLDDEVIRGSLIVHNGAVLDPPPPPQPSPPRPAQAPPPTQAAKAAPPPQQGWMKGLAALVLALGMVWIGKNAPSDFLQHFTVFVLACFVGWQVVWSVTPALHTPLMSVTNAISGIIVVGGLLQAGATSMNLAAILGAVAIFVAAINIFGGFAVTHRMLRMFRRGGP